MVLRVFAVQLQGHGNLMRTNSHASVMPLPWFGVCLPCHGTALRLDTFALGTAKSRLPGVKNRAKPKGSLEAAGAGAGSWERADSWTWPRAHLDERQRLAQESSPASSEFLNRARACGHALIV